MMMPSQASSFVPLLVLAAAVLQSSTPARADISPSCSADARGDQAVSLLQTTSGYKRAGPASRNRPRGHFLTNTELAPITAISCLEAKQRNPATNCANYSVAGSGASPFSGALNAGNYPSYQDPLCYGNGEFLCDPSRSLSTDERGNLTQLLHAQRAETSVTCGRLLSDPVDPLHLQPFYLGVALADGFPAIESDPESLQQFGRILSAQWNMDALYVGPVIPYTRCPNTAVLVILPDQHQAFLSSSSCEFICEERGGPEVVTAVLTALRSQGTAAAVEAGIRTAYRFLRTAPASDQVVQVSPYTVPIVGTMARAAGLSSMNEAAVFQQIAFGIAVLFFVGSLVVGLLIFLLAPGLIRARKV